MGKRMAGIHVKVGRILTQLKLRGVLKEPSLTGISLPASGCGEVPMPCVGPRDMR